jgi:hypothetical protein
MGLLEILLWPCTPLSMPGEIVGFPYTFGFMLSISGKSLNSLIYRCRKFILRVDRPDSGRLE